MNVKQLITAMEQIAPTRYAESWDNVGLLVGDPEQKISQAMLTIDYTPLVANEAKDAGCDAVIAYHPPIFDVTKRVTSTGSTQLIFDAIRRGVALYSPHTALDVAEGGTNDMLADALMLTDVHPLKLSAPKATECKLVTFVPKNDLEKVSQALFNAGAGQIGNYTQCSFRSPGEGTFFGEEGSSPTIGQAGQLEVAHEIRIETIVPLNKVEAVIAALRKSHPYEEPAFDLLTLHAHPDGKGMGRVGRLPGEATAEMLVNHLKRELELGSVLVAGDLQKMVKRAAVCAGACGNLLDDAIAAKVDLYVTGEMRHHDALKAVRAGLTVVCTLHSNSERAVLKRVQAKLRQLLPDLPTQLSQQDRDPFVVT
jgi:dinuclear metal center YbgI/SA1388 family protein